MNKYVINQEIGKGAFGKVRTGMIKSTGRIIAVKNVPIIDKKKSYTAEQLHARVQKIERESNVLKILSEERCPYIIKYIDSFNYFNNHLIFMEMCGGGTLYDFCKTKGYLEENTARKIIHVLLHGLVHMHRNGIVYGDLKPSNIMFKTSNSCSLHNQVRMIDFGCSKIVETPNKRVHGVSGTPVYMAPEVYKGDYGTLCDMWSLGVTLYYLMSSCLPILNIQTEENHVSFQTARDAICYGKFSFEGDKWSNVSNGCKEFIEMCITEEENRMSPGEALMHPWILKKM